MKTYAMRMGKRKFFLVVKSSRMRYPVSFSWQIVIFYANLWKLHLVTESNRIFNVQCGVHRVSSLYYLWFDCEQQKKNNQKYQCGFRCFVAQWHCGKCVFNWKLCRKVGRFSQRQNHHYLNLIRKFSHGSHLMIPREKKKSNKTGRVYLNGVDGRFSLWLWHCWLYEVGNTITY